MANEIIITSKEELSNLIENSFRKVLQETSPAPQVETNKLIGIDEVCALTHLSRQTIYCRVHQRSIPFIKRPGNKKLLFSREAILKWLQGEAK